MPNMNYIYQIKILSQSNLHRVYLRQSKLNEADYTKRVIDNLSLNIKGSVFEFIKKHSKEKPEENFRVIRLFEDEMQAYEHKKCMAPLKTHQYICNTRTRDLIKTEIDNLNDRRIINLQNEENAKENKELYDKVLSLYTLKNELTTENSELYKFIDCEYAGNHENEVKKAIR